MEQNKQQIVRKSGDALVACHIDQYEDLLNEKVAKLQNAINKTNATSAQQLPNIEVFSSPKTHFRMRFALNFKQFNFIRFNVTNITLFLFKK